MVSATNVVNDWLEPDGLLLLESWARDGCVVEDIATRVGVHVSTFRGWMSKYPEIKKAINNGRELVDYKVENALLKSALGYKTREVRVVATIRNGKVVKEEKETVDKEFAPNVGAIQTWLYNRRPDKWKPTNARSSMLDGLDEDTSIHITVERASGSEIQDGAYQSASGNFEEPDTDWQNDVNKEVTVRGLSEAEKKAQREKEKKSQLSGSSNPDDVSDTWSDDDDEREQDIDTDDTDWGDDVYKG